MLNEKNLIRKIRMDRDLNCIALVISSWHYLNAWATMRLLMKAGMIKKGIILAGSHPQGGFVIDEKLWNSEIENNIEKSVFQFQSVPQWKKVKCYLEEKMDDKRTVYILRPRHPYTEFSTTLWDGGLKRNYVHIVIDEGLGFYLRSIKGWTYDQRINNTLFIASRKKMIVQWQRQCNEKVILKRKQQLLYNTFFKKRKRNHLEVNDVCAKYLNEVFNVSSCLYNYADYKTYENKLIICTQPFNELRQVRNNLDLNVIRKVCDMAKEKNIQVIIKPHPREQDINKYRAMEVEVDINNSIPIEIILAGLKIKPKAMLGITTTSLATANILWKIPAYSIIEIIGKKNFSKNVKEDIYNFSKLFSEYVGMVNRLEDMFESIGNE